MQWIKLGCGTFVLVVALFIGFTDPAVPVWISLVAWVGLGVAVWMRRGRRGSQSRTVTLRLPVYASYAEAPQDVAFQLPDDPPHVVRLAQGPPHPGAMIVETGVAVAGVTFEDRQRQIQRLIAGEQRQVLLQHWPIPDHPCAVRVIGQWLEGGQMVQAELGWLPTGYGERYVSQGQVTVGATISSMFPATNERSAGMRLALWA